MHVDITGRELSIKILIFGPPQVGKSIFLKQIERLVENSGRDIYIVARPNSDIRFLERLVLLMKTPAGLRFRIQIVTVPGDPALAAVHQMAVSSTDGILFLASAQQKRWKSNKQAFMRLYDLIGGDKSTYNDVPLVVAFQADGEGPYRDIEELQALKQEIELPVFVDHQDENHELLTLWHLIQDTITYLETRHRVSSRFQMPLNTWQNVVRDFEQEILQSKTTLGGEK